MPNWLNDTVFYKIYPKTFWDSNGDMIDALYNNGDLEKELEITTFKDTNMIMMHVSSDNVKNISVSSEYLTFYLEALNEVTAYLYILVK